MPNVHFSRKKLTLIVIVAAVAAAILTPTPVAYVWWSVVGILYVGMLAIGGAVMDFPIFAIICLILTACVACVALIFWPAWKMSGPNGDML